jgi:hypothetical protein
VAPLSGDAAPSPETLVVAPEMLVVAPETLVVAPETLVVAPETLVVAPGEYSVPGRKYSLREEGLYRFLQPIVENRQCIVYRDGVTALMSAVCWLQSQGYRDNEKSFEGIKELARHGKVVLTCGDYSNFASELFCELDIPIRRAQVWTLRDHNGYNDGHALTEVRIGQRWIAYDPDGSALCSWRGQKLNLLEAVRQIRANDYAREPLAGAVGVAVGLFSRGGYDYDIWYETLLADAEFGAAAFRGIMIIPVIPEGDVKFFTAFSEDDRRRVEELYQRRNPHYLSPEEFTARFYGEGA